MEYKIIPCAEGDAEFIEEKIDEITGSVVLSEGDAKDEVFALKISDDGGGKIIAWRIVVTDSR